MPPSPRSRTTALALVVALVLPLGVGLACDRNVEPYQPGEEPRAPDLARIFPGGTGATGDAGAADAQRAADGGALAAAQSGAGGARAAFRPSRTEGAGGSGAASSGAEGASGRAARGAEGAITGRIDVAPELARAAPAGGILFVIARPQGAAGGPPLAVVRIAEPEFPVEFAIGPGDVMIPSMRFEGPIALHARLDADGNAMTRGASDLSSAPAEPLSPGATGVTLVLAQQG